MNRSIRHIFLIITLAAIVGACSSSRKASTVPSVGQATGNAREIPARVEALNARAEGWDKVKVPVTVALKAPVSLKLNGTLSMVRDSEVRLSLRFFGFEVAAAQIAGDSVRAYAKQPTKLCLSESVSSLLGGFPATVGNVQQLLLGRIFQVGADGIDLGKCTLAWRPDDYTVTPPQPRKGLDYSFTVGAEGNLLRSLDITYTGGSHGQVAYTYPSEVGRGMPEDIRVEGVMKNRKVQLTLELSPSRAEWGKADDKPFSIPSGYKRVSASSLLKLLSSGN